MGLEGDKLTEAYKLVNEWNCDPVVKYSIDNDGDMMKEWFIDTEDGASGGGGMFPLLSRVVGWLAEDGLGCRVDYDKRCGRIALSGDDEEPEGLRLIMLEVRHREDVVCISGVFSTALLNLESVGELLVNLPDCRGFCVGPHFAGCWVVSKVLEANQLDKPMLLAEVAAAREVVRECVRLLVPLRQAEA